MEIFNITFTQMLIMFLFIALGFLLKKLNVMPENSNIVFAKLENYILVPALIINAFIQNCTLENLLNKWSFVLCDIIILTIGIFVSGIIAKPFSKDPYVRNIYRYSLVFPNCGSVGTVLVLTLFGSEALYTYLLYLLPVNILVSTVGMSWLIPQFKGKFSLKVFLAPMCVSMYIGAAIGLSGITVPSFVASAVSSAAACMSPVAMIMTGFVVGECSLKNLFSGKAVYIFSVIRLIAIPVVLITILKLLRLPADIVLMAACSLTMPAGLNTVIYPLAYGGDTTPGASTVLVSQIMAIVTIPLILAVLL